MRQEEEIARLKKQLSELLEGFSVVVEQLSKAQERESQLLAQLTDEHGFVYRYHSCDGLAGREASFTICTFWLVDNLAMQGRVAEAGSLFERLLTYGGRLGLFSEEIDAHDSVAVGNYPQAFTHIALINSAINLQKAVERLDAHYSEPIMAALTIKLPRVGGER